MKIEISDDVYNQHYLKYLEDDRRFQIYKGGASAGKSYFIAQKVLWYLMSRDRFNWMVVRHTGADNHDSTFAQIVQVINIYRIHEAFKINESKGQEEITFLGNGNMIIFKGLDNVEKRKGVTFKNGPLQGIWVEESTDTTEHNINQLNIRLRGLSEWPKILILSFNPIDEMHWIKKRFFDLPMPEADGFICETTYLDNDFLNQEDAKTLESYKEKDPYYYDVYCLGKWGQISGHRILRNIVVSAFKTDSSRRVFRGLDFGYHDPNAAIECYVADNKLYISKEWVRNGLDPNEMLAAMPPWLKGDVVTCDSARPEIIRLMKTNGYLPQGAKKRISGNRQRYKFAMSQFLIHFDAIVIHPECETACREFRAWKWDETKEGHPLMIPADGDDHTVDATIYALERVAESYYRKRG